MAKSFSGLGELLVVLSILQVTGDLSVHGLHEGMRDFCACLETVAS